MSTEPIKYSSTLRAARVAAGVRQMDLAADLKMHRALLSGVELDKRLPFQVSRTMRLAAALNIDPVELMALSAAARGIDKESLADISLAGLKIVAALVKKLPKLSIKKLRALHKQVTSL